MGHCLSFKLEESSASTLAQPAQFQKTMMATTKKLSLQRQSGCDSIWMIDWWLSRKEIEGSINGPVKIKNLTSLNLANYYLQSTLIFSCTLVLWLDFFRLLP